jgi:hypothetical protein
MISNRASAAGAVKKPGVIKTLAAAMVLSLAGIGSAQACTGWLTINNNTQSSVKIKTIRTQNKNGTWAVNFSWPTGIRIDPNSSNTKVLNTLRNKNRAFRVSADTDFLDLTLKGEEYWSNIAKCSEGWTINID